MKRTYVRATIVMDAPWRVGAWDNRSADAIDTLRDQFAGDPMVPGSGIAGGLRSAAVDRADALFGPETGNALRVSQWWVLGTVVEDANIVTRRRVKIDRKSGTAEPHGLFTADDVTGGTIRVYFRSEEEDPKPFLDLLATWRPMIGAARTTGMGRGHVSQVRYRTLDLDQRSQVEALLLPAAAVQRVDRLLETGKDLELAESEPDPLLRARVSVAFLAQPDELQEMTYGTAWKGVLRSRVEFIARSLGLPVCPDSEQWGGCGECPICRAFGSTKAGGCWEFLDSHWTMHTADGRVRIGIDRFTGGARKGAWFRQQFEREVEMTLCVMGARLEAEDAWVERALLHALRDLDDGLIVIGPAGAVGFGQTQLSEIEFAGTPVALADLEPVVMEEV